MCWIKTLIHTEYKPTLAHPGCNLYFHQKTITDLRLEQSNNINTILLQKSEVFMARPIKNKWLFKKFSFCLLALKKMLSYSNARIRCRNYLWLQSNNNYTTHWQMNIYLNRDLLNMRTAVGFLSYELKTYRFKQKSFLKNIPKIRPS